MNARGAAASSKDVFSSLRCSAKRPEIFKPEYALKKCINNSLVAFCNSGPTEKIHKYSET